jgi:Rod binding domain-containing protein
MSPIDTSSTWYDFSTLSQLRASAAADPEAKKQEVVSQFESLFLGMMIKEMRKAIPRGGLLDSAAVKTYEQVLDQQLAVSLAKAGGIGLGDFMEKSIGQLNKFQAPDGSARDEPTAPPDTLVILRSRVFPPEREGSSDALKSEKQPW